MRQLPTRCVMHVCSGSRWSRPRHSNEGLFCPLLQFPERRNESTDKHQQQVRILQTMRRERERKLLYKSRENPGGRLLDYSRCSISRLQPSFSAYATIVDVYPLLLDCSKATNSANIPHRYRHHRQEYSFIVLSKDLYVHNESSLNRTLNLIIK